MNFCLKGFARWHLIILVSNNTMVIWTKSYRKIEKEAVGRNKPVPVLWQNYVIISTSLLFCLTLGRRIPSKILIKVLIEVATELASTILLSNISLPIYFLTPSLLLVLITFACLFLCHWKQYLLCVFHQKNFIILNMKFSVSVILEWRLALFFCNGRIFSLLMKISFTIIDNQLDILRTV